MTEEQKSIIHTMQKIAGFVQSNQLNTESIPLEDIIMGLEVALNYEEQSNSNEIVQSCTDLMQQGMCSNDVSVCTTTIKLISQIIQYSFSLREFFNQTIALKHQNELELKKYLAEDIVEHYNNSTLTYEYLYSHRYTSLAVLKEIGEIDLYKKVSAAVFLANCNEIKKKEKMKIVFLIKDSAEWSCEWLFHKFQNNANIELQIVVAPFLAGTIVTIERTYADTISYFAQHGYNVVGLYDQQQGSYRSLKEIGIPDIIFHLNPHYTAFQEEANICNIPLCILNVYIPYGMMVYGNVEHQFNQMSHALYWKIFCESSVHKQMAEKYADIGGGNVVNSGYVKMDEFYRPSLCKARDIWKVCPGETTDTVKKIIYAPHWSIKDSYTGFGNFDKIYMQLYDYVKEHPKTSWVLRPHPMLRAGVVTQGVFASEGAYDEYLDMWNSLPNAYVIEEGTYFDIFKTSDAMILDSVSFLAEYLYVGKPMLFLTRERQTFNDFGKMLKNVLYTADGGDFEAIANFIKEVVVEQHDTKVEERNTFFEKYLNYQKYNKQLASDYIYNYLCEEFQK